MRKIWFKKKQKNSNAYSDFSKILGPGTLFQERSWWLSGKESTCTAGDAGDTSSIPESGRSPGGEHGNPFQHSCLENPKDRGAWWAIVHGIAKSQTWLKWLRMHRPYSKGHHQLLFSLQGLWGTLLRSNKQLVETFKFIPSNSKERQCQRMLKLPHNCTHLAH